AEQIGGRGGSREIEGAPEGVEGGKNLRSEDRERFVAIEGRVEGEAGQADRPAQQRLSREGQAPRGRARRPHQLEFELLQVPRTRGGYSIEHSATLQRPISVVQTWPPLPARRWC